MSQKLSSHLSTELIDYLEKLKNNKYTGYFAFDNGNGFITTGESRNGEINLLYNKNYIVKTLIFSVKIKDYKFHCTEGAAYILYNWGRMIKFYYIDDIQYSHEDFKTEVQYMKLKDIL